jgi:KDO2-lipid IV(A) lauroyltransferase
MSGPYSGRPAAGVDRSEERTYTLRQRILMDAIDAALALFGLGLRVGGKPLKRALAVGLGTFGYVVIKRQREVARVNLDLVYGDSMTVADKKRIVRRMFIHFARLGLDFIFDTVYWPPAKISERVRAEGLDNLEAAFAMGRGVLCISGHLGNWEMMCASAAAHGYDFFGVFKRARSPWADRFIGRKRLRYGMSLLETRATRSSTVDGVTQTRQGRGVRDGVEAIWKSGRAVAFLCDQYPGKRGIEVPLLGVEKTPTAAGLLRYAVANDVPITLHRCVYQEDGNLVWTVEGPVQIEAQPGGEEATVRHYMRVVNDWLSESYYPARRKRH